LRNQRQARWVEELRQYNLKQLYWKGSSNATDDIVSRCPAFTSREGGTTSANNQTILQKEQLLEVRAMKLDLDISLESIQISAIGVEQLLLEAKERIKEKAILDDGYRELCKQVMAEGNIDKSFSIKDGLLCWKNRIYVPEGLQQQMIKSGHDSKIAGHFGRE
jgi:hypothetical protein